MEPVVFLYHKILLSDPGNLGFRVTSLACGLHSGDVILLEKAEMNEQMGMDAGRLWAAPV